MAQCQECHGQRYKRVVATPECPYEIKPGELLTAGVFDVPCHRCGGAGIESCCDGEDRWQQEKRDDNKRPT